MSIFVSFLCGMSGTFLGNLVSELLGGSCGLELILSLLFTLLLCMIRFLLMRNDYRRVVNVLENIAADAVIMAHKYEAALKDIPRACGYCKHYPDNCDGLDCKNISGINTAWEWRGPCKENGGTADGR